MDLAMVTYKGRPTLQYDYHSLPFVFSPALQINMVKLREEFCRIAEGTLLLTESQFQKLKWALQLFSHHLEHFILLHSSHPFSLPCHVITVPGIPPLLGSRHAKALKHQVQQESRALLEDVKQGGCRIVTDLPKHTIRARQHHRKQFCQTFFRAWMLAVGARPQADHEWGSLFQ